MSGSSKYHCRRSKMNKYLTVGVFLLSILAVGCNSSKDKDSQPPSWIKAPESISCNIGDTIFCSFKYGGDEGFYLKIKPYVCDSTLVLLSDSNICHFHSSTRETLNDTAVFWVQTSGIHCIGISLKKCSSCEEDTCCGGSVRTVTINVGSRK
jgi:hypothetical protein